MHRPVDSLNTNEVEGRVEDAVLEEALRVDSFTSPDLRISPVPANKREFKSRSGAELDKVLDDDFDLDDW